MLLLADEREAKNKGRQDAQGGGSIMIRKEEEEGEGLGKILYGRIWFDLI